MNIVLWDLIDYHQSIFYIILQTFFRQFQRHFLTEKLLQFVTYNKSPSVYVMTWCWTGDNTSLELMDTMISDVMMALVGRNEFRNQCIKIRAFALCLLIYMKISRWSYLNTHLSWYALTMHGSICHGAAGALILKSASCHDASCAVI